MIKNYLKIAWRNVSKHKKYSFINIFGLSIGISSAILIFLYSFHMLTQDFFHENIDRTYLMYKERVTPNGTQATYDTWVPLKGQMTQDFPQVSASARLYETEARIEQNGKYLQEDIQYTDAEFFEIFSFELKEGDQSNPFPNKNSVILTEKLSKKYFKTESSVGRDLAIYLPQEDTTLRYVVSAVIDDYPVNSSIQPTLMIQFESLPAYPELANQWGGSFIETYVMLNNPSDVEVLANAFPSLITKIWDEETASRTNFKLLPFSEYFDTFIGNKDNAWMMIYIALGLLLMASINFMNLSTAKSVSRSKEIGLRKVLGAVRGQLKTQFIVEAVCISAVATIIGLAMVTFTIPYINQFFDLQLTFDILDPIYFTLFTVSFTLLVGVVSGSYPAFYLSGIRTLEAIRAKFRTSGSINVRNTLVVIQFTVALVMISGTLLIQSQIEHMVNYSLGFDRDEKLIISASARDFTSREEGAERIQSFTNELSSLPFVKQVSLSRSVPTNWTGSYTFVQPEGWEGDPMRMRYTFVDANFFGLYGIKLVSGRGFLPDSEGDQRSAVILNEAAAKAFNFDLSASNNISIGNNNFKVVGVVADFNFESLRSEVTPTLHFHRTPANLTHRYITCDVSMGNIQQDIQQLQAKWEQLGATTPFTYEFLDDRINEVYEAEQQFLGLVSLFTLISIIIASLGMYGLTLFIIEKKRKEISIRKVLGAKISDVFKLVGGDFVRWIIIAFVLCVPIAWYFMSGWLEDFYYRISIGWQEFTLAVILMSLIVGITVGYELIRAALKNPVTYLHDE